MRKTILALLASTLLVSACGTVRDSRINPLNWFGPARSVEAAPAESTNPLIPQRSGLFARRAVEVDTYEGRPFEQTLEHVRVAAAHGVGGGQAPRRRPSTATAGRSAVGARAL